jgi:accessory gene regulator B
LHQTADLMGAFLSAHLNLDETRREEVTYGAFVFLETVATLVALAALAAVLGVLPETVVAAATGALLRRYSGGTHLSGPWRCVVATAISFALCGVGGAQAGRALLVWPAPVRALALGLLALACLCVVLRYAPVEAAMRPLRAEHKGRLRRSGIRMAMAYVALLALLGWIGSWLAAPVLLGFVMQCFSLTPAGRHFTRIIDRILDR